MALMKIVESGKFRQWLKKLKDETGKTRIIARINRLKEGLPGNIASVGHGVSELRIQNYGYIMGRVTGFIFINRQTILSSCSAVVTRVPNARTLSMPGRF